MLIVCREDYNRIFVPLLQRVSKVLKEQIEVAMSKGKQVKVKEPCHSYFVQWY